MLSISPNYVICGRHLTVRLNGFRQTAMCRGLSPRSSPLKGEALFDKLTHLSLNTQLLLFPPAIVLSTVLFRGS